jgi:tRNA (pseudouridine54-N1)-methyltransferase
VLDAPRGRTAEDFLIRDVPGTSGRLDVVCRILTATFRTIPEWTEFLTFIAVLSGPPNPPLTLVVTNPKDNSIPDSELACALIFKGLLLRYHTTGDTTHPSFPAFKLVRKKFLDILSEFTKRDTQIYYLVEEGTPFQNEVFDLDHNLIFLLGDDRGIPLDHEKAIESAQIRKISLGKQSYLGSHVVSLVLLELAKRKLDSKTG